MGGGNLFFAWRRCERENDGMEQRSPSIRREWECVEVRWSAERGMRTKEEVEKV